MGKNRKRRNTMQADLSVIKEETEDQIELHPVTPAKPKLHQIQAETERSDEPEIQIDLDRINESMDKDTKNKARIKEDIKRMLFMNIQSDEDTKAKFMELAKIKEEEQWNQRKRQLKAERFKKKRTLRRSLRDRDDVS